MRGKTSPNSSLTFVALVMAERRSRGWNMLFASRRLISLPQTTINPGSLWLISRGQRENKWQMGSGWVRYLSCAGSTPEVSSFRRQLQVSVGLGPADGSFSFCGWLKQKYKEKCSCLAAWRETVRSNKARAMDVNVFENTLVLTTCRSLRWWLLVSETVLKYQHNPTKLQRGIVLKGCIYFKIRKSLDEDCECKFFFFS